MRGNDWTRVLGWPGYKVYRHEIDEPGKRLKLWVRRKRANKLLVCSGCGKPRGEIVASYEREVRDLPWSEYLTTVVVELHRVRCPDCGVKTEKCRCCRAKRPSASASRTRSGRPARAPRPAAWRKQFGLAASTVRAIDLRYLRALVRVAAQAGPAADGRGRDLSGQEAEVHHRGEQSGDRGAAVVRRRAQEGDAGRVLRPAAEPLPARRGSGRLRRYVGAVPQSIEQWLPNCRIVYDKFHIIKHANAAVDEIRRAEFFRKGGPARELVKGKRWLLLTRWVHLTANKKQQLNELFALNRRVMKAYLLKESLDRLWSYTMKDRCCAT
jgi:transposase